MRVFLLIALFLTAQIAAAQDREGNDRPSDWVADHFTSFGGWDSVCDHRSTDGVKEQRCYLRYVDVFSPRPKFAAQFIFVTPGPEIQIGLERGTRFPKGGIRIEDNVIIKDGLIYVTTADAPKSVADLEALWEAGMNEADTS